MVKKKICMLGYYGVGKTSLVSQFVNHLFADKYQTTVGVKIDKKLVACEGGEVILMLWDVAGEGCCRSALRSAKARLSLMTKWRYDPPDIA
jgi:GTPase SAR1 family protein